VSDNVFQRYSTYYDLLYHDKDYRREVEYSVNTLRGLDPQIRDILEFGSGTGRHGRLLAQEGFRIHGVDNSDTMLAVAKAERSDGKTVSGSFEFQKGDIRTVRLPQVFDAVVSLFHVVSYQVSDKDVCGTFSNAARHLKSKGVFLFDVWHAPAVLRQRPIVRVKRAQDGNHSLIRIAEPALDTKTCTVDVRYTIILKSPNESATILEERHRMRYFSPADIDHFADKTGFEVLRSEEFLTRKVPSEETWGVLYLLRKKS
jgi:SAM-dependent methyltransferase